MSASRLVFCLLCVATGTLCAQGSAFDEARRVEEAALERARRMKAAKEEAIYEPAPRDLKPVRVSSAVTVSTQAMQQPEPFYFQVVTPDGLVPLEEWREQQARPPVAKSTPAAPAPQGPPDAGKSRTVRFAFLSVGSNRDQAEAEGRAVALEPEKMEQSSNAKPVAMVSPAPQQAPPMKAPPRTEVEVADPPADMVAVIEEVPSGVPGGAPKRKLLGFLSGKGLEAAFLNAESPSPEPPAEESSEIGNRGEAKTKSARAAVKQETASAPEAVLDEEPPTDPGPEKEREAFLNGLGQWLVAARKETFKPAWVAPKYSEDRGASSRNEETPGEPGTESPAGAPNLDFYTIKSARAPFHIIDTGAGQTHLLELDSGTVGRKHGEGDDWAWMQLDSGLMGLMKKRYLRPAAESEVVAYLAAETKSGSNASPASREVRYVEVDLPDLPKEAPMIEEVLGGGLFPPTPAMAASTSGASTKPTLPPGPGAGGAAESPSSPVRAPGMTIPAPLLPSIPVEAIGAGGIITVPSPVPILP